MYSTLGARKLKARERGPEARERGEKDGGQVALVARSYYSPAIAVCFGCTQPSAASLYSAISFGSTLQCTPAARNLQSAWGAPLLCVPGPLSLYSRYYQLASGPRLYPLLQMQAASRTPQPSAASLYT